MNIRIHISKAITLVFIALLFFSFKSYDWEYDKKSRVKIHTSISTIFNSETYIIEEFFIEQNKFYLIYDNNNIIGYFTVKTAPSKFHNFDYYVIFDKNIEILKIEVLHYRENYGAEICNKKWLQQFIGISTDNFEIYNRKIDGISGATLSVENLKKDVFELRNSLNYDINHTINN